jgi:anti-sigma28 factor (negative regulator of flagellin synthesis)
MRDVSAAARTSTTTAMESPGFSVVSGHGRPVRGAETMNVNNIQSTSPVQKLVNNPVQKSIPTDAPKQLPAADRLELSGVSHLLKALKANDGVRTDKVAEIKSAIESGNYRDDDAKLDVAVDRLLDDLLK